MKPYEEVLIANYGLPKIQIQRADGHRVHLTDGRTVWDLLGGIAVHILGHRHPDVQGAIAAQLGDVWHTSNLYQTQPAIELANLLQERLGGKTFLCNSGTEATEAALKAVRQAAGDHADRPVIAFTGAFHGRTMGALSLTYNPSYRAGFGQLPGPVLHVDPHDEAALQTALESNPIGWFFEPILGEGGVLPLPDVAVRALRKAQEQGCLLVCDGIQSGMYRTGEFIGFESQGLDPDMVLMAKALGGGLPIGAVQFRRGTESILGPGRHGTTFGGNPIACKAASQVIQTIHNERLDARAADVQEWLFQAIRNAGYEPRGRGCMVGFDVENAETRTRLQQHLLDHGVIVGVAGAKAIRITPGLNVPLDAILAFGEGLKGFKEAQLQATSSSS